VRIEVRGVVRIVLSLLICLGPILAIAQEQDTAAVPDNFNLDLKTAAKLRPQLLAQSAAVTEIYGTGGRVFRKLVQQLPPALKAKSTWELRIVDDGLLNAFSSPDGTIYVESGLADLAGSSAGLWAAILSHEIAHVVRRDWARRYLYEQSRRNDASATLVLGDPGLAASAWKDSNSASRDLAQFCRRLETDADLEGIMLMASAGYHPDFVPALHHLLHAKGRGEATPSILAMHPCWEERDRALDRAYILASIEFEHRWPEAYASPGGNPPILVFADEPSVKKTRSKEWEVRVPMHCQNLAGAVEVVLQTYSAAAASGSGHGQIALDVSGSSDQVRQLTGCTSPKTMIRFTVADDSHKRLWAEVLVLDDRGTVLSRAATVKFRP